MRLTSPLPALLLLCVGGAAFTSAMAQDRAQVEKGYVAMCLNQSVAIPAPMGESDLKGNPKLQAYCECFSAKFAERAIHTAQNPGPAAPLKQSVAEERVMRNDCRAQLGLPALKFSH